MLKTAFALAIISVLISALPAAAVSEMDLWQSKVRRIAPAAGASYTRVLCLCQDVGNYHRAVGSLRSGSHPVDFHNDSFFVRLSCDVQVFDITGELIGEHSCPDFVPLPR